MASCLVARAGDGAPAQRLRSAMIAALVLTACEPPQEPPASSPAPALSSPAAIDEPVRAVDGPMRLVVRRVEGEGWRGRAVVASFERPRARVRIAPSERPRPLDALVSDLGPSQPFAAIDGGFYDTNGEPLGLVRVDGADLHPLTAAGGSGVLTVGPGGPAIVHRDTYRPSGSIVWALQSVDRLVSEGRSLVGARSADRRAARSAVAIDASGAIHFVVAFDDAAVVLDEEARIELGVESGSTGPTLSEMAEMLARPVEQGGVGAREALGLDGGVSTGLTVKSATRALRVQAFRGTINALVLDVP